MRTLLLLVTAVVLAVSSWAGPAQARPADEDAPLFVLRLGRIPVGPPPTVPYLRGGHLDDDGRILDRELVDGSLVLALPGRSEWVGRLGGAYLVTSGKQLVAVTPDGQRRVLDQRTTTAFASLDGRFVGILGPRGQVRVLDATGAEVGSGTTQGADLVGMRGRSMVLRTYTSFPVRGSTTAWDPRRDRSTRLAPWPADLVDPTGRIASRWTRGADGGNCYATAALARPGVERYRLCGDEANVAALGPDATMLTSPTAKAGLGLRTARGRLLSQFRNGDAGLDSSLIGGPDLGVDARWESPGVVLIAAEALYLGLGEPSTYGVARCSATRCEWAGEPQPIS
jgi:hypothetical protein